MPGWGATTPRAAGWMGLCKSELPKMGRPLRPKEKGNGGGWLTGGAGKEAVEGSSEVQVPEPACSCVYTLPAPTLVVTQLRMLTDQPFMNPLALLLC